MLIILFIFIILQGNTKMATIGSGSTNYTQQLANLRARTSNKQEQIQTFFRDFVTADQNAQNEIITSLCNTPEPKNSEFILAHLIAEDLNRREEEIPNQLIIMIGKAPEEIEQAFSTVAKHGNIHDVFVDGSGFLSSNKYNITDLFNCVISNVPQAANNCQLFPLDGEETKNDDSLQAAPVSNMTINAQKKQIIMLMKYLAQNGNQAKQEVIESIFSTITNSLIPDLNKPVNPAFLNLFFDMYESMRQRGIHKTSLDKLYNMLTNFAQQTNIEISNSTTLKNDNKNSYIVRGTASKFKGHGLSKNEYDGEKLDKLLQKQIEQYNHINRDNEKIDDQQFITTHQTGNPVNNDARRSFDQKNEHTPIHRNSSSSPIEDNKLEMKEESKEDALINAYNKLDNPNETNINLYINEHTERISQNNISQEKINSFITNANNEDTRSKYIPLISLLLQLYVVRQEENKIKQANDGVYANDIYLLKLRLKECYIIHSIYEQCNTNNIPPEHVFNILDKDNDSIFLQQVLRNLNDEPARLLRNNFNELLNREEINELPVSTETTGYITMYSNLDGSSVCESWTLDGLLKNTGWILRGDVISKGAIETDPRYEYDNSESRTEIKNNLSAMINNANKAGINSFWFMQVSPELDNIADGTKAVHSLVTMCEDLLSIIFQTYHRTTDQNLKDTLNLLLQNIAGYTDNLIDYNEQAKKKWNTPNNTQLYSQFNCRITEMRAQLFMLNTGIDEPIISNRHESDAYDRQQFTNENQRRENNGMDLIPNTDIGKFRAMQKNIKPLNFFAEINTTNMDNQYHTVIESIKVIKEAVAQGNWDSVTKILFNQDKPVFPNSSEQRHFEVLCIITIMKNQSEEINPVTIEHFVTNKLNLNFRTQVYFTHFFSTMAIALNTTLPQELVESTIVSEHQKSFIWTFHQLSQIFEITTDLGVSQQTSPTQHESKEETPKNPLLLEEKNDSTTLNINNQTITRKRAQSLDDIKIQKQKQTNNDINHLDLAVSSKLKIQKNNNFTKKINEENEDNLEPTHNNSAFTINNAGFDNEEKQDNSTQKIQALMRQVEKQMEILGQNVSLQDFKMLRDLQLIIDTSLMNNLTDIITATPNNNDSDSDCDFSDQSFNKLFTFIKTGFRITKTEVTKWFNETLEEYFKEQKDYNINETDELNPVQIDKAVYAIQLPFIRKVNEELYPKIEKEMNAQLPNFREEMNAQLPTLDGQGLGDLIWQMLLDIVILQATAVVSTPTLTIDIDSIGTKVNVDLITHKAIFSGERKLTRHGNKKGECTVFIPTIRKKENKVIACHGLYEIDNGSNETK